MKGLIYLASPYSHESAEVREARFHAVVEAAGVLMRAGHVVYSPIAPDQPARAATGVSENTTAALGCIGLLAGALRGTGYGKSR